MADFKPDYEVSSSLKELAQTWGQYIVIISNKNINLNWVGLAVQTAQDWKYKLV